ncbi:MAG TPA: biotin/lipoyl-containing protein [Trueperaceae bacterium]|nr:biotin/lipoyl-containing protein [Trueperaceae bacterium]
MPALGMAQESGVLIRWLVPEGGAVVEGDPLMEVETDKAVVEVPATASGRLARVAYGEGAELAVGTVLAVVLAAGEVDVAARAAPRIVPPVETPAKSPARSPAESPGAAAPGVPAGVAVSTTTPLANQPYVPLVHTVTVGSRAVVLASPKAKRLARERGLDLARITGSGPAGAVRSTDLAPVGAEGRSSVAAVVPEMPGLRAEPGGALSAAAWLRTTVDAAGLSGFVERVRRSGGAAGSTAVETADVLTRVVAAGLARDAMLATSGSVVSLSVFDAHGVATVSALRGKQLGSMLDVAAARAHERGASSSRAPHAGASGQAVDTTGHLQIDIVDRSAEQFERSPTTLGGDAALRVTLGPIVEALKLHEGTTTARSVATVQLDYDPTILDDTRAAALITYVSRLLGDPFALAVQG